MGDQDPLQRRMGSEPIRKNTEEDKATETEALCSLYDGQSLDEGEVRMLSIETTPTSGDIQLRTRVVSLAAELDYDAVSYVWGAQDRLVHLRCNDGHISLTPSTIDMIVNLARHRSNKDRLLWIDAICINQTNQQEKATQVAMMREIFEKASQVIIWLGGPTPDTDTFMADFPRVHELSIVRTGHAQIDDSFQDAQAWPPRCHSFWIGFFHILNNEWFRRLWTFQEIVCAKTATLMCGTVSVDADKFLGFIYRSGSSGSSYIVYDQSVRQLVPSQPFFAHLAFKKCRNLQIYRTRGSNRISSPDLPWTLYQIRTYKVKEEVDRVWSILGLLEDDIRQALIKLVDYSEISRMKYWNTHIAFSRILLEDFGMLNLLNFPSMRRQGHPHLPSWCPELSGSSATGRPFWGMWNEPLSRRSSVHRALCHLDKDDTMKSARRLEAVTQHPSKTISVERNTNMLRIRGVVLDCISEVVDNTHSSTTPFVRTLQSVGFLDVDDALHTATLKYEEASVALARKVHGVDEKSSSIPLEYLMSLFTDSRIKQETDIIYKDFIGYLRTNGRSMRELPPDRSALLHRCLNDLDINLHVRTYFATEGGRFGVTTSHCKVGDKVCTFYGGQPLYILRWQGEQASMGAEHSDQPAHFVGAAFVPHLMEASQAEAARLGPDEDFVIR